jgi:hypothetical protein
VILTTKNFLQTIMDGIALVKYDGAKVNTRAPNTSFKSTRKTTTTTTTIKERQIKKKLCLTIRICHSSKRRSGLVAPRASTPGTGWDKGRQRAFPKLPHNTSSPLPGSLDPK